MVHGWLLLVHWWLLLLYTPVHHVLLLGSLLLREVLLGVVLLRVHLRPLHMVMLRRRLVVVGHMMAHTGLRRIQRRAATRTHSHRRRLKLAARVHYRGLVAVRRTSIAATHVHTPRTVRPAVHSIPIHLLLLRPIVRGVPDIHSIVRRKPRVRHPLRRLSRSAVMVRWDALP